MLSGIANVALIPRILDVDSLRGFYEDKLQILKKRKILAEIIAIRFSLEY